MSPVTGSTSDGRGCIHVLSASIVENSEYWTVTSGANENYIMLAPLSASNMDQRVIFAVNLDDNSYYRDPHAVLSVPSLRLSMGITPDHTSGSFTAYNSATPFGASTAWSRYWHCGLCNISPLRIGWFEGEGIIALSIYDGNQAARASFLGIAGLLLEHSGSEFYGMFTGGQATLNSNFWNSTVAMMGYSLTQGGELGNSAVFSGSNYDWAIMNRDDTRVPDDVSAHTTDMAIYQTGDNIIKGHPVHYFSGSDGSGNLLGVTRGIYRSSNVALGAGPLFMSGSTGSLPGATSTDHVYGVAARGDSTSNAVFFFPASGSGLPQDLVGQGF